MADTTNEVTFPIDFLSDLAEATSVQQVLDSAAFSLLAMLDADRASVAILSETDESLHLYALDGNEAIPLDHVVPMNNTLVGFSIKQRTQLYTANVEGSSTDDGEMLFQGGLRSCVNTPLVSSNTCFGSVNVASYEGDAFSDYHLITLAGVASLLASHLRIHSMAEEAQRRARTDELTGLLSRRAVISELGRRLTDEPEPVSILFVDLDDFKLINDVHGHMVGDKVLRQIGDRFDSALRPDDLVGRIGGDEFLIILDGMGSEHGSRLVAKRVDRLFRRPIHVGLLDLLVRPSIGTATSSYETPSAESLLTEADLAMYCDKRDTSSISPST